MASTLRRRDNTAEQNSLLPTNDVTYSTFQQPAATTTTTTTVVTRNTKPKQPNRTTKISQKLKLFPDNDDARTLDENLFDADVYTQLAQIPHGSARIEAERLNKIDRNELSRATAYCTARFV